MTEQRSDFLLDVDDDVCLTHTSVKRAFCRRSFWILLPSGRARTSARASVASEPRNIPWACFVARGQQRRIQTFAAEKGARPPRVVAATSASGCVVRTSRAGPPLRLGNYFGIRLQSRPRIVVRPPLHFAAARQEASLRSVPRSEILRERKTPREFPFISISSFSPFCSLIKSTKPVQRCWHGGDRSWQGSEDSGLYAVWLISDDTITSS